MNYSMEERLKIVKFCFQNNRPIILMQRSYRNHFHVRQRPSTMIIRKLMAHLQEESSVINLPPTGGPRAARSEENIEIVTSQCRRRTKNIKDKTF